VLYLSVSNSFRSKKSFTWKWSNEHQQSFGTANIREQVQQSFNDWTKHASITFREVSQNEKADIELALVDKNLEGSKDFDGSGGTLAFVSFRTGEKVRFEAVKSWVDK
jgi:hypothetical protein